MECNNILNRLKIAASFIQPILSFPDYYGRPTFFNELKFGIQSDATNIKVEFVEEVDPINSFEMTVNVV